ncbi:DEAD/DEAH box helicase [Tenacibaculum sp. nBUS_03]|uniref:DEAD/DEAH box helicase n=1 Tax=Tenacibaculum sp. nBUS_03 TaxID=3395320 RepID=UPI003EBDEDFB
MPFKKLDAIIKQKLSELEFDAPTPFQIKSIPVIKSGKNLFCTAPTNSGKTTGLILTTMQKLKCKEVGTAPRATVFVENNEKALELYNNFLKFTKSTSLRVYVCDEREHIDLLKSEIFEGVDILITTPKTMNKLLLLEGVNTTQLKIVSFDDAEFLTNKSVIADVLSATQSIHKCQYIIYLEKMNVTIQNLESYFMHYAGNVIVK